VCAVVKADACGTCRWSDNTHARNGQHKQRLLAGHSATWKSGRSRRWHRQQRRRRQQQQRNAGPRNSGAAPTSREKTRNQNTAHGSHVDKVRALKVVQAHKPRQVRHPVLVPRQGGILSGDTGRTKAHGQTDSSRSTTADQERDKSGEWVGGRRTWAAGADSGGEREGVARFCLLPRSWSHDSFNTRLQRKGCALLCRSVCVQK